MLKEVSGDCAQTLVRENCDEAGFEGSVLPAGVFRGMSAWWVPVGAADNSMARRGPPSARPHPDMLLT